MPKPSNQLNTSQIRRFAELRAELEVWGSNEATGESVLIKYVSFMFAGKSPSKHWILTDYSDSAEEPQTYLGSNAVEALSALERMRCPPNCSLPLHMQIRFLHIINNDINQMLALKDEASFVACNLRTLRGLIINLALAYSDQHCPDFLSTLNLSQQALAITADPKADKIEPLIELKNIISARLIELNANEAQPQEN